MTARPKVPSQIQMLNVALGSQVDASGGTYVNADAQLTAHIAGDADKVFTILSVDTFDVETETDTRPPHQVLVHALSVAGPGPIQVFAGEAILVTVQFACPADPVKANFTGAAVLQGTGIPAPISVSILATARLGTLDGAAISAPPILPGETKEFVFRIFSTRGHIVPIALLYDTAFERHFTAPTQFPPPVPAGGSIDVTVPITCVPDTPAGTLNAQFRIVSPDGTQPLGSFVFPVTVATRPGPPPVDPSLVWEESTMYSILVNQQLNAWHAGHLNDVLLRSDAIFVASQTGGVWGIDFHQPDFPAGCPTDNADNPNFSCFAPGPDSALEIFAACEDGSNGGGLYLGGFAQWSSIPIANQFGSPITTGTIFRMAVLKGQRVIVLATDRGVFWSRIPPSIGGTYVFQSPPALPPGRYSGMAVGPNESLVVGRWGAPGGIFVGTWSTAGLVFTPAQLQNDPSQADGTIDPNQMRRISIAACGSNPSVMYAVVAGPDNHMYRILRSDSSGNVWRPVRNIGDRPVRDLRRTLAPDVFDKTDTKTPDMAGPTGWYTNCIAVDSHNPNLVGIGWANGPWLSANASDFVSNWTLAYEQDGGGLNDHVHADIHAVLFDPADASGRTIYACNDGGLMRTLDQAGPDGYQSAFNTHLRNLQFYGWGASIVHRAGLSASPKDGGLIAGPTQDNGNLYCALDKPDPNAWVRLDGGDGVSMCFLSNGLLLDISPNDAPPLFNKARLSRWDGSGFRDRTVIPVSNGPSALSVTGDVQPVEVPHFRDPGSQKQMLAVATTQNLAGELRNVYGLFSNGDIFSAEWTLIATLEIDHGDSKTQDAITSVSSLRGDQVFAGTQKGRIFSFAPFQKPFELTVTPPDKGPVHDIVTVHDSLAFALFDGSSHNVILQSNFFNWDPLGSNENVAAGQGLPTDTPFTALTIDRGTTPPTLYAATDNAVYVSRDEASTWILATKGLPKRPHCTGLAVGAPRGGSRYLYLATYGRSVWQARLS